MRLALLLAALLALAGGAEAQQLDFKRVTRGGDELLSYRWRDAGGYERRLSFTLTREAIRAAEVSFAEYSLDAMWTSIERDLRDEVARFGDARIDIHRTAEGLRWTVEAPDRSSLAELQRRLDARVARSKRDYAKRYQRHVIGERRIEVDFAAATQALRSPLQAVAKALGNMPDAASDERARIGLALGFFQAIPYVTLEDRKRQGGDFLPAPALLAQNRGDCDSKAVALAAVLRGVARLRKLAVVTMPGHALLAVEMPARPGDTTIRRDGRLYVALEPAGPAVVPVGHVGPTSARYLAGTARNIEIWPLD
jgi:hypothetical protein